MSTKFGKILVKMIGLFFLFFALSRLLPHHEAQARNGFAGGHSTPGAALPPLITSVSGQGTAGGPVFFNGSGFASKVTVWCDDGGGVAATALGFLPILNSSSTLVTAGLGTATAYLQPPFTPGVYTCILSNATDGGTAIAKNQLIISSTSNPSTILSGLRGWYKSSNVSCGGACSDGGSITQVNDLSGNGYNLTNPVGHRGVYHTQSTSTACMGGLPCFGFAPTITCDGTSSQFFNSSFNLSSTSNAAIWIVMRNTSTTPLPFFELSTTHTLVGNWAYSSTTGDTPLNSGGTPNPGVSIVHGIPYQFVLTWSSGVNYGAATNNSSPLTTAATANTINAGSNQFNICSTAFGYNAMEWVEAVIANDAYDATKWQKMSEYFALKYNLPGPTPIAATQINTSGGSDGGFFRISGTGFVPGMTISISDFGISNASVTVNKSNSAEYTLPGGSYALGSHSFDLINPDGTNGTGNNLLVVTSNMTPMIAAGSKVDGWWDADVTSSLTCVTSGCPNGTKLSGAADLSYYTNNFVQGTSAAEPTLSLNDAVFGGTHNAFVCDGSAAYMNGGPGANLYYGGVTPIGVWELAVAYPTSATNSLNFPIYLQAGGLDIQQTTGKPRCYDNGQAAQWGSGVLSLSRALTCSVPAGSSPTLAVNVDNGTAVSVATAQPSWSSSQYGLCGVFSGSSFYAGKLSAVVLLKSAPTTAEATNLQIWATNHGAL